MIHHTFGKTRFGCVEPGLWRDDSGRWEIRYTKGPKFPFPISWKLYDKGRHVTTRDAFWHYATYFTRER
jgi:hypothetical protein